MKKLIISGAALLAIFAAHDANAASPAWNWSGFYLGANTGSAWSEQNWESANGALAAFTPFSRGSVIGGPLAGLQGGFNWQSGPWVFSPEISGDWADIHGAVRCGNAQWICNTNTNWFVSVTGRAGYAVDRLLYYVKGGATAINDKEQITSPFVVNVFNGSSTRWGPTVGGGIEYAFTPSLSAFFEYDYSDFTGTTTFTDQFGLTSNVGTHQNLQLVKIGMNYRPWPDGTAGQPGSGGMLPTKAPPVPMWSDWTLETGLRYWFSTGKTRKDLYDPFVAGQLDSRLTYGPQDGGSVEGYARFDHASGLFIKGFIGIGDLFGGNLKDEDFPPTMVPYSATNASMNGKIEYGALDIGHIVLKGDTWNVGAFVGYRQYYQVSNGFGCTQVATNPFTCVPAVPQNFLALTQTEDWRGVAVGLNGSVMVTDRLKFSGDVAYLPYVNLSAFDNHWWGAFENPATETGSGWGTQLEAILSYAVTDRWSLGIGGRYWYFASNNAKVEETGVVPFVVAPFAPEKFMAERYGGFVQTSYKFDGSDLVDPRAPAGVMLTKAPPPVVAVNWTGPYAGVHVGGGFGVDDWNSATGVLGLSGPQFPGSDDVNGMLAGGQLGYDYQTGSWVFGVQADASWIDFDGNAKCAVFIGVPPAPIPAPVVPPPTSATCNNKIDGFGTITGRVGQAVGRFLLYSDGGAAWAHDNSAVTSFREGPFDYTGQQTRWGWTVGGGIAYALTPNWSIFGEYDYLSFGTKGETMSDPIFGQSVVGIGERLEVLKAGVNYKLD